MEVGLAVIDAKKDSLSKRFSAPLYRSQLSQNPFEDAPYFLYHTEQWVHHKDSTYVNSPNHIAVK